MKKLLLAALLLLIPSLAAAQTCPPFSNPVVLTAGQWQACFNAKQNSIGYTPINKAGDTMLGRLVIVAPTGNVGFFSLTPGPTPGSPNDGNMWVTTAGLFVRIGGVSVGPLIGSGSTPTFNNIYYANGYANLEAAIAAISTTSATLVVTGSTNCSTAVNVLATTKLVVEKGGLITKTSSCTLAISGPVEIGDYQAFSGFAAGNITFGAAGIKSIPEWFDTPANMTTAAQTAVASAFASITAAGQTVRLLAHAYPVTGTMTMLVSGSKMICDSAQWSLLYSSSATTPILLINGPGTGVLNFNGNVVQNCAIGRSVTPSGVNAVGISMSHTANVIFDNVVIQDNTTGFAINGDVNNFICNNCQIGISTSALVSSGSTLNLVIIDSSTAANPSVQFIGGEAFSLIGISNSTILRGVYGFGAFFQDFTASNFSSTKVSIAYDFDCTAATCTNVNVTGGDQDSFYRSVVRITNAPNTGQISLNTGRWAPSDSATPTIRYMVECISSANVSVTDVTMFKYLTSLVTDVYGLNFNDCANAIVNGNRINDLKYPIIVTGPNGSANIVGNTIANRASGCTVSCAAVTMVWFTASTTGNALFSTILIGATTTGVKFDSGSIGNKITGIVNKLTSGTFMTDANAAGDNAYPVCGPLAYTNGNVPQYSTATGCFTNGVAIGTAASNLVQLNGSAQLPAVDGSLLTGIAAGSIRVGTTTIANGTVGRILYHAASDLLGEMTTTGSGTVVALQTSPSFLVGITSPVVNLSATSNQLVFQSGGVTGTLSWTPASSNKTIVLPNGSTDFTATGGTSQVVKQVSAGAAFTVARLACADLSDAGTACTATIASYLPLAGGTMTGGIGFSTTNTLDIGTSATVLAPRTVYAGTSFVGPVGTFTTSMSAPIATHTTSVAAGGCTIGSDAFCATGNGTVSALWTAANLKLSTGNIYPSSNSTTALGISQADGTTKLVTFDTTNKRVGINKTPGAFDLDVNGAVNFASTMAVVGIATFTATPVPAVSGTPDIGTTSLMWGSLFLKSLGVINFNAGNYTITHSAGLLTTNGALTISGALAGVTTLTATTINAHTLGGAIAGAGQKISNFVIGDSAATAFTAGNIVFAGTSGIAAQDSLLAWDATNHLLGIAVAPTAGIRVFIKGTATASNSTYGLIIQDSSGGNMFYVRNDGFVAIPAISSDAGQTDATLCITTAGGVVYKGSGTLGICLGTSSARYKNDIKDLNVGLNEIAMLQAKRFYLDAQHGDPNKLMYGFTAEDCAKVLPALAGYDDKNRPNTCDYLGVVPVAVKAIQELKAANDNLKTEIETLKRSARQ